MIIPVFQPIGKSTHMLAKKIGQLYGEKATHTGTLDPMAKGVIIVMTGEDRFDKEKFNRRNDKTYKFTMMFGVKTDSHDLLGLTTKNSFEYSNRIFSLDQLKEMLLETLPIFHGTQQQTIPKFSAKRIAGKSYFDKAKKKEKIDQQSEEINIDSLRLIEMKEIEVLDFQEKIEEKLNKIHGNFRQNKVKKDWEIFFTSLKEKNIETIITAEIYTRVSKRTYIRGLVRDISARIGIPATTTEIFRVKNGKYGVKDCICLV